MRNIVAERITRAAYQREATICHVASCHATTRPIAPAPFRMHGPPMIEVVLWGAVIAASLSIVAELAPDTIGAQTGFSSRD